MSEGSVQSQHSVTDALGEDLSIGDTVVFVHKTAHSFQTRGTPRYVKAVITGFTAKMIVVDWVAVQQLPRADNTTFTQPPHTGHWTPGLCVRIQRAREDTNS